MSDRTPEASTAADHRTPRVRWPATTRGGLAASAPTAQERPRRDVVLRAGAFFFAGAFFLAVGFFLACVGFRLTLVLRLTTVRLAFFLTLLPRTWTVGAAAASAAGAGGTEIGEPEPPG